MAKLSREKAVELIIKCIEKGETYSNTFGVIRSNSELSESTFALYWKEANQRHYKAQQDINESVNDQLLNERVEAKKRALERQKIRLGVLNEKFHRLSKIKATLGDVVANKEGELGETPPIDYKDEINAIKAMALLDERISKAEGTDAPTKTALTDPDGNEVKKTISSLESATLEQLEEIVKMGTK